MVVDPTKQTGKKMINYDELTREELLVRVKELESLVEEYQRENVEEEKLNYAWTGNLGH